jgi:hypothetical protein
MRFTQTHKAARAAAEAAFDAYEHLLCRRQPDSLKQQLAAATINSHTHASHTAFVCCMQAHKAARAAAEAAFYEHLLGRRQADSLKQQLAAAIAKEHKGKVTANVAESNTLCQALEMECTKQLAGVEGLIQVPSMYQFEGRHKACVKQFEVGGNDNGHV